MLRFVLAACLVSFPFASSALAAAKPNIIVILSDDMGWSDLGCYGGEINTPVLDRLAANGLRYTQFYNTARCCPTRACLLTGLYPHQAGIGHMTQDKGLIGYRGDLNRECLTMAEALKPAGYGAYAVGKWHVTKGVKPEGPKENWPLQRGFDRFYGTITGAGNFYDPGTLTRDNQMISPAADPEYQPERFYYTDAISDHAVRYISEHRQASKDKPFVYVAFTCAHWPMHAPDEDIAKYKGKYDAGYAAIREARLAKLKQLGLVGPDCSLTPGAEDWDKVNNKAWEARCMETYAAMIDIMDRGIGRIVAQLEKQGDLDNTLICFMQDNGGCAETVGRQATAGGSPEARPAQPPLPSLAKTELLLDVIPKRTRDGYQVRQGQGVMPGAGDTYIAYGRGWANVSNTPWREYKHWVHEGGVSTPLIVHWPAGLKRHGELERQPAHLIDIMATCVDVAEAKYPSEAGGQKIQPLEGVSLRPTFSGEKLAREAIYWEHEGNRAIRKGSWKLVAKGPGAPWELYDIDTDRTELRNLAGERQEQVQELKTQWEAWANRARVLPWIWQPAYGETKAAGKAPAKKKAKAQD